MSQESENRLIPSEDKEYRLKMSKGRRLTSLDFWKHGDLKKDVQLRHNYEDCVRDFNWFRTFAASDVSESDLSKLLMNIPEIVQYAEVRRDADHQARVLASENAPLHILRKRARSGKPPEYFAPKKPGPISPREVSEYFIRGIRQKTISFGAFSEFYRNYMAYLEETETTLLAEFREDAAWFLDRLQSIREPFSIPEDVIGRAQKRLSSIEYSLRDPMLGNREGGRDAGNFAFFEAPDRLGVNLPVPESREMRRHYHVHELVHALLEGRILRKEPHNTVSDRKSGLYFKDQGALNEGVTEFIALAILGTDKLVGYATEVEQVRVLIKDGISAQLFFDAYTENYVPGKRGIPRTKELFAALGLNRRVENA